MMRRTNFLLTALSLVVVLGGVEVLLWAVEHTKAGAGKFDLLRAATYEQFYFFHASDAERRAYLSVGSLHGAYDPLLGWRNRGWPVTRKDTLNSDGWRASHEYTHQKNAGRRVILIGDSFTYGYKVDDAETMDADLGRELGPDTEVYSMAVPAFGTDQMALVATRLAPAYSPDVIIVNFIAEDMTRSCRTFNFKLRKPYFIMGPKGLELKGVPVPTWEAVLAQHTGMAHFWDGLIDMVMRLRTVRLLGQVALQGRRRDCLDNLNPAIFQYMRDTVKPGVRLIFAHLDGDLSPGAARKLQRMPQYADIPPIVQRLSASTGIPQERFSDEHPKPNLLKLYALALAEVLRRDPAK